MREDVRHRPKLIIETYKENDVQFVCEQCTTGSWRCPLQTKNKKCLFFNQEKLRRKTAATVASSSPVVMLSISHLRNER